MSVPRRGPGGLERPSSTLCFLSHLRFLIPVPQQPRATPRPLGPPCLAEMRSSSSRRELHELHECHGPCHQCPAHPVASPLAPACSHPQSQRQPGSSVTAPESAEGEPAAGAGGCCRRMRYSSHAAGKTHLAPRHTRRLRAARASTPPPPPHSASPHNPHRSAHRLQCAAARSRRASRRFQGYRVSPEAQTACSAHLKPGTRSLT